MAVSLNSFKFVNRVARGLQLQWPLAMTRSSYCHTAAPPPIDSLTDDEQAMRDTVQRFAKEQIGPLVKQMDEEASMPESIIKACFDNGLMGLEISQDYQGVGASFTATCLVIEEMSKVDMGSSLLVDVHNTVVAGFIQKLGNEEQKQKYLPKLANEWVGCFCLSEESSGSDAFALKTRAVRDGDSWVLNGTKMWISAAPYGDLFVVMANANPEDKHRGITCFLVERDTPGLSIGPKENKMGIRSSQTASVILEDVRVPAENVLGEIGKGYKYAITMLNEGRVGIGAQLVGVAQGCLDHTIPYLLERKQFGQPIYNFQGLQHQVATAQTRVQAARTLVYDTARRVQCGLPFMKQAAMAKYYASDVACYTTSKCIEWMGGVGITKDYPIEKYYRDCKVGTIYEGSSNIQLNTIAKQLAQEYKDKM